MDRRTLNLTNTQGTFNTSGKHWPGWEGDGERQPLQGRPGNPAVLHCTASDTWHFVGGHGCHSNLSKTSPDPPSTPAPMPKESRPSDILKGRPRCVWCGLCERTSTETSLQLHIVMPPLLSPMGGRRGVSDFPKNREAASESLHVTRQSLSKDRKM